MKEEIVHRTGTLSLEGDIYHYRIREGAEISLQDAEELVRLGKALVGDRRVGALVDARVHYLDSKEAREYFAEGNSQFAAIAILVNGLAQRLLVNFYINVHRPHIPTRLFASEAEALRWLRSILDQKNRTSPGRNTGRTAS